MEDNPKITKQLTGQLSTIQMEDAMECTASLPGIIAALAELNSQAIVTEEGVAHLFNRHAVSVKRAVQRGELPQPCHLFGVRVWTAGVLIRHIERRLEQAAKNAQRTAGRIARLSS